MDQAERVRLSLQIAEFQAAARERLQGIDGDDDVSELIDALGICEVAARRWHMQEAVQSGLISMPEIEDFDDGSTNVFND